MGRQHCRLNISANIETAVLTIRYGRQTNVPMYESTVPLSKNNTLKTIQNLIGFYRSSESLVPFQAKKQRSQKLTKSLHFLLSKYRI